MEIKVIFITWLTIIIINFEKSETKVEVTSGIYLERLPNISFYQTTRQIIFRVKKNQSILDKLNCRQLFCAKYPYMCDLLLQKVDYFANLKNNPSSTDDNILLNDGELFDFQLATRSHLKKMFANDYEISLLVSKFSKRDHVTMREMNFPNLMLNDHNLSCTDSKLKDLVLLELELQYESSRSLVTMCQLKRLAVDFLPLEKLGNILNEMNLENNNYVLALGSLVQLYTMPLVECIMSPQTILVGIHIPLLKKEILGLHMMRILTPAYAWENYTCTVNVPTLNIALLPKDSTWKIFLPKCDPLREELCLISDYRDEENIGTSCVQQVLKGGSFKQFSTNCPIACRETGNDVQFMTPISSHRTYITHPKDSLHLKCNDGAHTLEAKEKIGTLSITMPCHCHFEDDDQRIYPTYTCVDKSAQFSQHQIIPAAWTHYTSLSLPKWGDPPLYFDNLEDCLDYKWINSQFPNDIIPIATYFLILLFILILISTAISIYLYYQTRTSFVHLVQCGNQKTFVREPKPTIHTTPTVERSPLRNRRQLPVPRTVHFEEEEDEYLQPSELRQQVSLQPNPSRPTPTVQQQLPRINAYVPRPAPTASTSNNQGESAYVRMDRFKEATSAV